jgi:hypothetical protein
VDTFQELAVVLGIAVPNMPDQGKIGSDIAGLDMADLDIAGLDIADLDIAGLGMTDLDIVGLGMTDLDIAGLGMVGIGADFGVLDMSETAAFQA